MDRDTKEVLSQIYRAAVAAADPYISVRQNLSIEPGTLSSGGAHYSLPDTNNIYVIGAGKAAYGMAKAVEDVLKGLINEGAVVTKDGHGGPLARIRLYEASHPVPDGRGVLAASRIMDIATGAGEDDLVLCLLSGGASALMALPAEGLALKDKQAVTRLLLASGADIGEINCVRKHLSGIKGGRLAEAAYPARVSTLIISDVIGDDIGTIASGPTAPDETTFYQASDILLMRGVYDRLPRPVADYLEKGRSGLIPETPKPGEETFAMVDNVIIASNRTALGKAKEVAEYLGYSSLIFESPVQGEAREAAARLAREARKYREGGGLLPACLIVGGETTVTIKGGGMGGRNQEMALAFAAELQGYDGIAALFAGTDGTDGPTDAAGAFADGRTVGLAHEAGLIASDLLADNDSYHFFEQTGDLFSPGPTGTNVMDIGIILVR
ncbi:MAG TPA: glycerate kinase [Nitrospirota bacterium]|nr:glycerate kinase [Nitrospirota bacterium]